MNAICQNTYFFFAQKTVDYNYIATQSGVCVARLFMWIYYPRQYLLPYGYQQFKYGLVLDIFILYKSVYSPFTMILVMVDSKVSMIFTVPAAPQDTHASFEHVPTNAPQGAIMLQPEAGLFNGKSPEHFTDWR